MQNVLTLECPTATTILQLRAQLVCTTTDAFSVLVDVHKATMRVTHVALRLHLCLRPMAIASAITRSSLTSHKTTLAVVPVHELEADLVVLTYKICTR